MMMLISGEEMQLLFIKNWKGDACKFLEDCRWDAVPILKRLKIDKFKEDGILVDAFPSLWGDKMSPLWIRMLRDNIGISNLKNLDMVPQSMLIRIMGEQH
jgi:hypothetical protein